MTRRRNSVKMQCLLNLWVLRAPITALAENSPTYVKRRVCYIIFKIEFLLSKIFFNSL